jgi:hypothetical protein
MLHIQPGFAARISQELFATTAVLDAEPLKHLRPPGTLGDDLSNRLSRQRLAVIGGVVNCLFHDFLA